MTCLLPIAAARAGVVHVPINPLLKRAQVAHIVKDSGAMMLTGNAARLGTLEQGDVSDEVSLLDELDIWPLTETAPEMPPSNWEPDALAAILYTSGSTGRPKGVMLSHANLWLGAVSVATYLGLQRDDNTLAVLPLSFDYGQNQLLSTWLAGGTVVPLDYLFARDVVKACSKHKVTALAGVPPLWVQLSEVDWTDEAVRSLRRITNSGGALSPALVANLRRRIGDTAIYAMYGLTEAFRSTYLDPDLLQHHPTSIGKAVPFAEVLVVDPEGRETAEGELVHCGPLVAQGYWQNPSRTAERFRPAPVHSTYGGMAVWSGDTVRRDSDGLLYFVGREDAMIKSSGHRISPQEIENAATGTGLVGQAVAIGVPDDRLGQAIHLVVTQESLSAEGQAQLRQSLAARLPNFMQPHQYHWRDRLPVNANGKIDRARLVKEVSQ